MDLLEAIGGERAFAFGPQQSEMRISVHSDTEFGRIRTPGSA